MAAQHSVRDGSDTGQATRAAECDAGRHRLRVVGYLLGPRPLWLDCLRPLRVVCRDCDHETRWACDGHRESVCKPCASRYRRRVRSVAESGTRRGAGYGYLLTLTAPGREAHRMPSGDLCPCTPPGGVDLARWNASHSSRWNRLRTALRRDVPELQFFRGVEVQDRGALHDHALMWSPVRLTKRRLKELALAAGFGHSIDLAPITSPKQASYYVSKYVTKSTDQRDLVPWWAEMVDTDTGEVYEDVIAGRYRTWSMSREWGLTMRAARAAGRAWYLEKQAADEAQAFDLLAAAFDCELIASSPPLAPS
jgi:hypothetical protein